MTVYADPSSQAAHTSHANLYATSYWGQAVGEKPGTNIVDNRNLMAAVLKLSPCDHSKMLSKHHHPAYGDSRHPMWMKEHAHHDHTEFYKMEGTTARVIIFSPYGVSPEEHKFNLSQGFTPIIPMYSNDTQTYMKCVSDSKKGGAIMPVPDSLLLPHNVAKWNTKHTSANLV